MALPYYERHLPHWQPEQAWFFVTFRLHGSLPKHPEWVAPPDGSSFVAVDRELDAATVGPVWLRDARIADATADTLMQAETEWHLCDLRAWVIMSNHVHALLYPHKSLAKVMQVIKSASARRANELLGRAGQTFWQAESYDHWARDLAERDRIIRYIEHNPVTAGLVDLPENWRWSSAAETWASHVRERGYR